MKTTAGAIHIHVHHHDMEQHARSFNEGYETAMAQYIAPDGGTQKAPDHGVSDRGIQSSGAVAQRPWTNPRVVKRASPGEWEPQECVDASDQEPCSPTPRQAIAQVIYETCYVRLPAAYEDRNEPDGYAEDWAECMEGASRYVDALAALADKQSTDAPWQNQRLIAKLVGAWLRGSGPR